MKNNKLVKRLLLVFLALVMIACVIVPLPYYIEEPGETINLKELITVNDKQDEHKGSFSLTSVGIRRATVFTALAAQIKPFREIISVDDLTGGASDAEYMQIQKFNMETSQNFAIEQALKLANKPYEMEYKGVYVLGIEKNSNFANKISVGDTVTKADGKTFTSSEDFMKYVKSQKVGQEMTVTYIHEGKTKEASGKLIKLPTDKKPGIGITLTDHTEINAQDKVKIDAGDIGGPSAGLMFTLEIYEQLIDKDLRHGEKIAGTGTISPDGEVGRIGGIDKKVASAAASGNKIFFAPNDEITKEMKEVQPGIQSNYAEAQAAAKKLKTDMKIVPVKNVQDALAYLAKMQ
ncbi:SepM family pheromone-processing serine protease [Enterococcus pseudoavium]|uniref:endopeptidase La n=1 Tax=Enterococcus pseudoavium TaxID=44007 RepID=A0ABU3FJF2_9ENTE|nr:SepM family pheromone-processing serine protease [Enterococcus pseudoavium]MDT2755039.1 SepM family pheromone-processing serine protease [Enterococcus pseudoavium]MDT2770880.1 SepM family pheromone-processing serine protease [Enterococcus pseudoavium]